MATKCGEIMTKDIVCSLPEDSVEHVAALMKAENVGPVPVVASHESKNLLGIVTDRDLVVKVIAEGRDPKSTLVRDVMSANPVTCRTDDDVDEALDAMSKHKVRRIPIADEQGCIVGIISQADVATRVGKTKKTGEVVEEISK